MLGQALLRPAVRSLRGLPIRMSVELERQQGRGPRAVFLPSADKEQSSLLRIYNIAQTLRSFGWRTIVLPRRLTLQQRQRMLARFQPSVVVMQGARHALNRPEFYADVPIVYDMDDADFHLPHLADAVRQAMPQVAGVIAGSAYVADWCRAHGASAAEVIWTGTPVSTRPRTAQADRPPVIAWAQTAPASYTREAGLVLDVMRQVSVRRPEVSLRLYGRGPKDGAAFLDRFKAAGIRTEWRKKTNYRDYLASFDDVALGLAPLCPDAPFSRGKSFGKVLAYVDRHVPVIASDACEHARFFEPETGVVSNDPDVWIAALDRLLGNPAERQVLADAAFAQFEQRLSVTEAARRTDAVLRNYIT